MKHLQEVPAPSKGTRVARLPTAASPCPSANGAARSSVPWTTRAGVSNGSTDASAEAISRRTIRARSGPDGAQSMSATSVHPGSLASSGATVTSRINSRRASPSISPRASASTSPAWRVASSAGNRANPPISTARSTRSPTDGTISRDAGSIPTKWPGNRSQLRAHARELGEVSASAFTSAGSTSFPGRCGSTAPVGERVATRVARRTPRAPLRRQRRQRTLVEGHSTSSGSTPSSRRRAA